MPLPGSHGIYSLPEDTITAIVALDDVAAALPAVIGHLRPGTATWLIHHSMGNTHVLAFTDADTYYRVALDGTALRWPDRADAPTSNHAHFTARRHHLILVLDRLFLTARDITADLKDPTFPRENARRAMLVALLHHWWTTRATSGVTPRAALFMLSLLLPLETLALVPLPALPDEDEDAADEDDVFWLDPSTRVRAPLGYTITPPPSGSPAHR
jgi:hypothetical protein